MDPNDSARLMRILRDAQTVAGRVQGQNEALRFEIETLKAGNNELEHLYRRALSDLVSTNKRGGE